MRLIGYVRVSTKRQLDGYGPDVQKRAIRAWCRTNGHTLLRGWKTDSYTGTTDDRPELTDALELIADGKADGIAVMVLDRLARELTVQEAILAHVWQLGGRVFTTAGEVLQDDPDDPMRTAMRQMVGVFAQLDRAMAVKRMRDGRKVKAAAGGYAYGAPRYGWRAHDGELVADPTEQAAIRLARRLARSGHSLREIAVVLERDGHRPRRGPRWHPNTVAGLLRDPAPQRRVAPAS